MRVRSCVCQLVGFPIFPYGASRFSLLPPCLYSWNLYSSVLGGGVCELFGISTLVVQDSPERILPNLSLMIS